MDLTHAWRPVLSDGLARVVACLAATSGALTGRGIAKLSGLSQAGAHKILTGLVQSGIVTSEPAGSAALYQLNRSHVLTPHLLGLLRAGDEVLTRMRSQLAEWDPAPLHASLFGSVARAEANSSSDIDLLLVRRDEVSFDDPNWRHQVGELARSVHRWSGQFLASLEFSEAEFAEVIAAGEPIAAEWRRDHVDLAGSRLSALAGRGGS